MPKVQVITAERVQQDEHSYTNEAGTVLDYYGADAPLHLRVWHIEARRSIAIEACGHDTIAYIWKGAVDALGTPLDAESCLVVENGGKVDVEAGIDGASVVLFAGSVSAPARPAGSSVHLLPSGRVPRKAGLDGGLVKGALFADAVSLGLPLWLHENEFPAGMEVGVHSHSEDEIIFVVEGSIVLGRRDCGPGTALAVSADTKYGFHAGQRGLKFINFRAQAPTFTPANGDRSLDEGAFWREATGIPVYI